MSNDPSQPKHDFVPRREAVPFPWLEPTENRSGLTEGQRAAGEKLWSLVDYRLRDAPPRSRYHKQRHDSADIGEVLPPIDDQRRNAVVLIDGKRGLGKTALLVTLIDAWNRAARGLLDEQDELSTVCDRDGRVIPLGLLDLRSLPVDTSLLLHVTSVFRRLVKYLGVDELDEDPPTSPLLGRDGRLREAWQDFRQAAAALEIRIGRRSATLDPEAFAHELLSNEDDRIDIRRLFAALLDELVDAFVAKRKRRSGDQTPVFVIAIDDADMSPGRVGECFELLELLEHPRLVFVFAGESTLFRASLRAQFLGELRRPLGGTRIVQGDIALLADGEQVLHLAERYYEKLIPPSHRCVLPELLVHERIEHVVAALDGITLGESTMGTLLRTVPVIGEALPPTLRGIEDLRLALAELRGKENPALGVLKLVRDSVLERESLAEPVRAWLADVLVRTSERVFPGPRPSQPVIDAASVELRYGPTPRQRLDRDDGVTIEVCEAGDLGVSIHDMARPPRAVKGVVVLANYVGAQLSAAAFAPSKYANDHFVRCRAEAGLTVAWPRLRLDGPASLEFVRRWEQVLNEFDREGGMDAERLALAYLRLQDGIELEAPPPPVSIEDEQLDEVWRALVRPPIHRERVATILRLACPELGLPSEAAARILTAVRAGSNEIEWSSLLDLTQQRRAAAFSENRELGALIDLGESPSSSTQSIDDARPTHPWVEARREQLRMAAETNEFYAALQKVHVEPNGPNRPSWWPEDATAYLTPDLREALATGDPEARRAAASEILTALDSERLPEEGLYRAWKRVHGPSRHGHTLAWRTFGLQSGTNAGYNPGSVVTPQPRKARFGDDLVYVLRTCLVWDTEDENIERVAFWVGHDVGEDKWYDERGSELRDWDCIEFHRQAERLSGWRWRTPKWRARVDLWLQAQAWNEMIQPIPDSVGWLARSFVFAQVGVFQTRSVRSFADQSWIEVAEAAVIAYEGDPARSLRKQDFVTWLRAVYELAHPYAGLESTEAAALLVAYIEILHPLLVNIVTRGQDIVGQTSRSGSEHPWALLRSPSRAIANEIRRVWIPRGADFSLPPGREQAVELFAAVLGRFEAGVPGVMLSAYLTPDLLVIAERCPAHWLGDVSDALESEGTAAERLFAAWQVCRPILSGNVTLEQDGLQAKHDYDLAEGRFVALSADDLIHQLWYGRITRPREDDGPAGLDLVLWPLILDYIWDQRVGDDGTKPQVWKYYRHQTSKSGSVPRDHGQWLSPYWRTRVDQWCAIESWNRALYHVNDQASPVAFMMRTLIAANAHVYRTRTVLDRPTGTWREVVQDAVTALNEVARREPRASIYEAWIDSLRELAKPDKGLTETEAANLLVSLHASGRLEPDDSQPQASPGLIESIEGLREDLHPARRVELASSPEQVREVIKTLKVQYEID